MSVTLSARSVIEAILFVGGEPVPIDRFTKVLRGVDEEQIVEAIADLNQQYHRQNRPYTINHISGGYQFELRHEYQRILAKIGQQSRKVRLSQAAIEVLAIVAYRQPVSIAEVDELREIDSGAIMRQLRKRNLIDLASPEDQQKTGRQICFATTERFLELLNLGGLDDLPRVQEDDPE